MRINLGILLGVSFLISCSSVKKYNENFNNQDLISINVLDGIYNNKALNGNPEFTSLWSTINYNTKNYENWDSLFVKLNVLDNELIIAELLNDKQEVLDSKTFKGKMDKGYFLLKRQWKITFLPIVVIWGMGNSSVKIGKTENDELIMIRQTDGVGMLVAVPVFSSNSPMIETKYKTVN